jgi:glutathione S-transferase
MSGTYKLYGRLGAGSLAPQIVLEEIGAPYEIVWVSKAEKEVEALKRISPAGKIPVLVLPDGTVVRESAAILLHLTAAHPQAGLAPQAGSSAHARYLETVVSLSANMYDTLLRYFYADRYASGAAGAGAGITAQALADWTGQLQRIATTLSPYLLGAQYSAADPYLHMLASWYPGDDPGATAASLPQLQQHAQLVRSRAATRKAEKDHAES